MSTLYRSLTFTTGSIAAGGSTSRNDTILSNRIDIVKIKVQPSIVNAGELTTVQIFKSNTFSASDIVYATTSFTGNLIDPIETDGITTTERNEGFVCRYEDLDGALQLHIKISNNGTVARTFTATIYYKADFDNHGVTFDLVRDFGADNTGTNDSSSAMNSAISAVNSLGGHGTIMIPAGTFKMNAIDIGGASGLHIIGAGRGFSDGNDARTIIQYNGAGATPIFKGTADCENVRFESLQLQGPTQAYNALSGIGVQFMDSAAANMIGWHFEHVTFAYLDYGFVYGSGGSFTGNQMLFTTFEKCAFWSCNTSIFCQAPSCQLHSIRDTLFRNGWYYYIHATTGFEFELENIYLGPMGATALGAIVGPVFLKWFKGWSEICETFSGAGSATIYNGSTYVAGVAKTPLLSITSGASTPSFTSILEGVLHARPGDNSGYSIYHAGGPLELVGCAIGGQIQWDSRHPWNRVDLDNCSWIPCNDSDITQTAGTVNGSHPWVIGPYSGADADFYIRIHTDISHFQWKKTSGAAYSADIPIVNHYTLQEGLIACFGPAATWIVGQEWKFSCSKTGLVNLAGFKPEASLSIRAECFANANLVNTVTTTVAYTGVTSTEFQDLYDVFNTTTGKFTTMFAGRYKVHAQALIDTSALAAGVAVHASISIFVNGVERKKVPWRYSGNVVGLANEMSLLVDDAIYLSQGDYIEIKVVQTNGSAATLVFSGSANVNVLIIERLTDMGNLMQ